MGLGGKKGGREGVVSKGESLTTTPENRKNTHHFIIKEKKGKGQPE